MTSLIRWLQQEHGSLKADMIGTIGVADSSIRLTLYVKTRDAQSEAPLQNDDRVAVKSGGYQKTVTTNACAFASIRGA